MSPTILRERGYRLFFFSREELRMHVHVQGARGEAKFWMEPRIELAQNHGLTAGEIWFVRRLIQDHADDIRTAWKKHFGS